VGDNLSIRTGSPQKTANPQPSPRTLSGLAVLKGLAVLNHQSSTITHIASPPIWQNQIAAILRFKPILDEWELGT
jgi:hypothetical protein